MFELENFIYCDSCRKEENRLIIENIINILSLKFIPTQYSFGIVFNIKYNTKDKNISKNHTLEFAFLNKDDNKIIVDIKDIPIAIPITSILENGTQFLNFNLNLQNVPFEKEGCYASLIYIDGTLIGEKELYVAK